MGGPRPTIVSRDLSRRWGWRVGALCAAAVAVFSCHQAMQAPGQDVKPTTNPLSTRVPAAATTHRSSPSTAYTAARTFQSEAGGFRISYPSSWEPHGQNQTSRSEHQGKQISDTTVLTLVPVGANDDQRSISIDLPTLPPHIPGLIPLGLVGSGYISDMRQQHPGLKVQENTSVTVAGAQARRVYLTWQEAGKGGFDRADLIVHGDHIVIFSADGFSSDSDSMRQDFDQIVSSLRWTK